MKETLERIDSFLNNTIIGREDIIQTLMYALLTRHHVMLIGKPGIAKSMLARELFACLSDAKVFKIQCTKRMGEEYLVGPLDMKLFRREGKYRHITTNTIVDAHFAFLDEFLDLPEQTLRALLEVLNERTFTRGEQACVCPIQTAIACTNFTPSGEGLEAVEDRFLFRARLESLSSFDNLHSIVSTTVTGTYGVERPFMTMNDLNKAQSAVRRVTFPAYLMSVYVSFCIDARKAGLVISERRIVWGIEVMKASAYLRGSKSIQADDFAALDKVFIVANNQDQMKVFASAAANTLNAVARHNDVTASLISIEDILNNACAEAESGSVLKKRKAKQVCKELVDSLKSDPISSDPNALLVVGAIYNRCNNLIAYVNKELGKDV